MIGWLSPSGPRPRWQPWTRIGTAAALAFLALAAGVPAESAGAVPEIRIDPTTLYFGAAAPPAASAAEKAADLANLPPRPPIEIPQALRDKAAKGGVRVIVQLAASFRPEGTLGSAQALEQRQAISRLQDAALRKAEGAGARVNARYERIPFLALQVGAAALDLLAGMPEVVSIQEDVFHQASLASSNAVIGSGVAWSKGLTGAGQTIAVLDTGVDKTHPYFSSGGHNKVVSEACYSSNFDSGYYYEATTSLCPGGVEESTAAGSGANCSVLASDCKHGTHVAGIAAGNDGVGPNFGVARDADVIAIQVFSRGCAGACLGSWSSDEIKGLERVYALAGTYQIASANLSLGGSPYWYRASCDAANPAFKAAIDNLRSIDVATVAAAGNYGEYGIAAPACVTSAVSVGATDDGDVVAYFSNVSPELDLMAPGVGVTSSVPGGGIAPLDGTSMSSPHVAGAWAVLRQANPGATVSDVLAMLRATAVQVGGFGYDLRRINLGKAVTAGPLVTKDVTIYNDGAAVLSVLSLQLETPVPWIRWIPEAPFDVPPGGSRKVTVMVDFAAAPPGASANRLIIGSTDADENPYPDAVHLVIDKQACYPLTRSRTGNGGLPAPSPSSSPGCAPGQYNAGSVVQLAATPAIGWGVQSWSGTDNDASAAAANQVTMPAAPKAVAIAYFARCYALTRTHTGSGGDPVAVPANSPECPAGQYKYAEPIQLTAAPTAGWRVAGWTNTAADASHKKTNSLTMPAAAVTVSVSYLEGLPTVLMVYDDSYYAVTNATALAALGRVYEEWNLDTLGNPTPADLSPYPVVLWQTEFYGSLSTAQENVLAGYLNGGGNLFLISPRYMDNRGGTTFNQSYLGVGSWFWGAYTYRITGRGSAFGSLGTRDLYYSGNGDSIEPAPGAELALENQYGEGVGVSKVAPGYRSLFITMPLIDLSTADQAPFLGAGLDFLDTIFADVPPGYWAKKWIEAMYRNGITTGCSNNPRQYCPENVVTRGQMAVFLLLSKQGPAYVPPPCTTAPFSDVPASSPLCPWIQELAARGVTTGCGGGNFCPNGAVSRDQLSVFLLSTLEGPGYAPAPCTSSTPFTDIAVGSPFCPWVAEIARRGITSGCGGGSFCASSPVNRAQMAVFLVTSFHLPLF